MLKLLDHWSDSGFTTDQFLQRAFGGGLADKPVSGVSIGFSGLSQGYSAQGLHAIMNARYRKPSR